MTDEKGIEIKEEHICDEECDHNDHIIKAKTMKLELEDGTIAEFGVIDIFEHQEYPGNKYIALVSEDSKKVYLYKYIEEEENIELENIEEDKEFEDIAEKFESNIVEIDEEFEKNI